MVEAPTLRVKPFLPLPRNEFRLAVFDLKAPMPPSTALMQ
jgi:hypothetical protein